MQVLRGLKEHGQKVGEPDIIAQARKMNVHPDHVRRWAEEEGIIGGPNGNGNTQNR